MVKVSFICNPVYINNGWSPWDTRVGGTEECIIEWSKRLQQRGYEVQVFHNGQHGEYEGITYRKHSEFEAGDVTINVNYPQFKEGNKKILLSSLTDHPDLSHFDIVCAISKYQIENCGIQHKDIRLLPPGYDQTKVYPGNKIPKQCFYASSPDRGLATLLEAWPKVHEKHPDATLLVTYGGSLDLPGVINLGEVDEDTMCDIYRTSDIWCHPANGGELYCMTGIKAQASGCVPVYIPIMALAETVRNGYKVYPSDNQSDLYAEALITALDENENRDVIRNFLTRESYPSWESTTDILENIIKDVV